MDDKITVFYKKTLLNCRGKMLDLGTPKIMGILNLTPDSFYDGGYYDNIDGILRHTEQMLKDGAAIIDVGGMSTRPGAKPVTVDEELKRVIPAIKAIARRFPEAVISIDTVKAAVATEAVNEGTAIINDVSAGNMDVTMFEVAASLQVPYIAMHMQGTPETMQHAPNYIDVTQEALDFFIGKVNQLRRAGVNDVLIDPGFGFGKTVEHNYTLLRELDRFAILGLTIVVGLSRKSMICKVLKKDPKDALNGTTALHSLALLKGANILRVHDVKEAREVVKLMAYYVE